MWICRFSLGVEHILVGDHLEAQAVQCVRRVREQFAQEDLPVLVQRMDQDVQQLPGLCLEGELFGGI